MSRELDFWCKKKTQYFHHLEHSVFGKIIKKKNATKPPCCISAGGSLGKRQSRHLWEVWDFLWAVCVSSFGSFQRRSAPGLSMKTIEPVMLLFARSPGKHPGRVKEGNTKKKIKKKMDGPVLVWGQGSVSQPIPSERSFHQCRFSPPYLTPSRLKKFHFRWSQVESLEGSVNKSSR